MIQEMPFSQFRKRYPNNDACLEEIIKIRYPDGIVCRRCKWFTTHYKVKGRLAYTCKNCRKHMHPLAGTLFEKTSTPLRLWFYAMFLMTQTRGMIPSTKLKKELGVTYKTAWRMKNRIYTLMALQNGDLLSENQHKGEKDKMYKWVFFKHFEISVIEKEETSS